MLLTSLEGTNGGVAKPHPFVKYVRSYSQYRPSTDIIYLRFKGFGTFKDVTVLNSPAQAVSVGTTGGAAIIEAITVDNCTSISASVHRRILSTSNPRPRVMREPLATTLTASTSAPMLFTL
jgi:hypothetical protein